MRCFLVMPLLFILMTKSIKVGKGFVSLSLMISATRRGPNSLTIFNGGSIPSSTTV